MNLDTVLIEAYEVEASIGVFDWEKEVKQCLVFDLALFTDFSQASATDDIQHAVNYASVCSVIEAIVHIKHYQLLEALAETIAQKLLEDFAISSLQLSIRKPGAVPKAKNVGVKITRGKPSE